MIYQKGNKFKVARNPEYNETVFYVSSFVGNPGCTTVTTVLEYLQIWLDKYSNMIDNTIITKYP